jgi:hypothetical protein
LGPFVSYEENEALRRNKNWQRFPPFQPGSEWQQIIESFDWRRAVAGYLFREVTMEDYFREFVHTLASLRRVTTESLASLKDKLVSVLKNFFFLRHWRSGKANHYQLPMMAKSMGTSYALVTHYQWQKMYCQIAQYELNVLVHQFVGKV